MKTTQVMVKYKFVVLRAVISFDSGRWEKMVTRQEVPQFPTLAQFSYKNILLYHTPTSVGNGQLKLLYQNINRKVNL